MLRPRTGEALGVQVLHEDPLHHVPVLRLVPHHASKIIDPSLGEKRRAALLTVTRTAYDASGAVIEHGAHLYRASRYSFETKLFSA